jgi:hypothetical protein
LLLRTWWLVTLLLAALGLIMGGAHVLELPVRMQYEARFYMQVTSTLYRYFGLVGGPIQIFAFFAAVSLAGLLRRRAAVRSTVLGAGCLGLSLVIWFLLVQPVNVAWAEALRAGGGNAIEIYPELRSRWEYGHVAAFIAWFLGFTLLIFGVLQEVESSSTGT